MAACHDANSKLVMYFGVTRAFVNYLESLDNFTDLTLHYIECIGTIQWYTILMLGKLLLGLTLFIIKKDWEN